MKLFFSLVPEVIFISGSVMVIACMWSMAGWQYGMMILGMALMIAAAYVNEIMNINIEGEE